MSGNPALFHIVEPSVWAAVVAMGEYRPPSLEAERFVHFSFVDQVEGTANLIYRDAATLVVVEFDPARLGSPVVVEDSYGSGTSFPHVYAPIPTAAATKIHPLTRAADGSWRFSAGAAGAASSPDR